MPFATLEKFIQNDTSVNLHYLDRCNQNKTKIIKTNYKLILNEQIRPEIVDILHSVIEKYRYQTISPYSIDIDTTEVDCISSIDAKEVPFLDVFLKAIQNEDVEKVTDNLSNDINTNMVIASYTINDGDRAIGFTSYNPLNLFKGKKIFSMQNSYEVKNFRENLISIPNYFDCIYIQSLGKILIFQKKHFETIFKYKEEYISRAKSAIEIIREKAIIKGVDLEVFPYINRERSIKKLANIFTQNKIDKILNNFDKVIKANNSFPEEDRIKIDIKAKKLILEENASEKYVEVLLSILNLEPHQNIITQDIRLIADQRPNQLSLLGRLGSLFTRNNGDN